MGKATAAAAATGGAALVGLGVAAATSFADAGDALDKMSQRTGISVESLSALKFAAEQSGSSIETVEKASRRLGSTILDAGNGLAGAKDALDQLGLSATELQGLAPEEQFRIVAAALAEVDDASTKAALAQDVFGKSGAELLPLINQGAEGMAALENQARDLGAVMTTDAAKGAADFKDAQNELMTAFAGVAVQIGRVVLPVMTELVRALGPMIQRWGELASRALPPVFDIISQLVPVLLEVLDAVIPMVPLFAQLAVEFVGALLPAVTALIPAFLEIIQAISPILPLVAELISVLLPPFVEILVQLINIITPLIVLIATGLTLALRNILPPIANVISFVANLVNGILSLRNRWQESWTVMRETVKGIADTITRIVGDVVRTMTDIRHSIIDTVNAIIRAWNSLEFTLPSVSIDVLGIRRTFGGFTLGTPNIPLIPKFERGVNNFRGGPAIVGERGPEMVQLPRGSNVIPNRESRGMMGTTVNIVIEGNVLDGDDFREKVNEAVLIFQRRGA